MDYERPSSMLDQIDRKLASIQQNMATAPDIRWAVMLSATSTTAFVTAVFWVML